MHVNTAGDMLGNSIPNTSVCLVVSQKGQCHCRLYSATGVQLLWHGRVGGSARRTSVLNRWISSGPQQRHSVWYVSLLLLLLLLLWPFPYLW